MEVMLKIPDSIYRKDVQGYDKYFKALQQMVNRMANSHEKYQGERTMEEVVQFFDEIKSALQRVKMYDDTRLIAEVWDGQPVILGEVMGKPVGTGNVENLLDASNMLVIESIFPKHPKAHFRSQGAGESPGMEYLP